MMPSCDQIGVPIHFHSSMTSGAASVMSLRILLRVSPRQSPSSEILFEMSSDADWPWLAPDFFMFSSCLRYAPGAGTRLARGSARAPGSAVPAGDGGRLLDPGRQLRLVEPVGLADI